MQPALTDTADAATRPAAAWLRYLRSSRMTLVIALVCATILLVLIDQSYDKFIDLNTERRDIQLVRETVDGLIGNVEIAESSQRGILLTDDPTYHERFDRARQRVDALLTRLRGAAPGTSLPASSLAPFESALMRKMEELRQVAGLQRSGREQAASFAATSDASADLTNELHNAASRLVGQTDTLIAVKDSDFARLATYFRLAFLACVLAMLCAFVLYIQQRHRLRESDLREQQALTEERNRLEAEVLKRTQDLAALATYLQNAVENERSRLSHELHDELGALMTTAKLDVARLKSRMGAQAPDMAERIEHLRSTLNDAIALKRRIMEGLYPSALKNLGLVQALQILTREFAGSSGIRIDTVLQPVDLDADTQLTIYRMVQEALTNVGKYAKASQVDVRVENDASRVRVSVRDNGAGFDPGQLPRGSHGLAGMRHRLQACGGVLSVDSSHGRGTTVSAVISRLGRVIN